MNELAAEVIKIRRHIHRYPAVSGREEGQKTMKKIWMPLLLIAAIIPFSACVHSPEKSSAGRPADLQTILKKGELVVGMTGKQPPLNMKDKEGRVIGLEPELARRMA